LIPDSYFVVRNLNGAPTLPLVSLGTVLLKKLTVPLLTDTATAQDNAVSMIRPLDVSLNATGLKASDGSFLANDRLLVFNNAVAGFDKSPSATYFQAAVTNGPWRLVGDNATDRGGEVIPMGTGFIIRKATTAGGAPAFWTNNFPVSAVSAVSRRTHGAAGDFDINLPLTGTPGVECRSGTTHKVIFTFPAPVTFSGAAVTSGAFGTAVPTATSSTVVTVDLTGVTDVQRITVTLLGVSDGSNTNDVAVRMGILSGDTNGNGSVSATDVAQCKSLSGQAATASNFRSDVAVNGSISATDIALVKSRSGTSLPPP